jgi:toxin ParE1/3/4
LALKIEFTPQARTDLRDIWDWVAQFDDRAADRIISRIRQTVSMFAAFPELGHAGSIDGTREFKVTGLPYLIVYQTDEDCIDVLTIVHSRSNYPDNDQMAEK